MAKPALVDITPIYSEAPLEPDRVIPNVVYQTWKTPWLDAAHARLLGDFRAANPHFAFRFFDDAMLAAYMDRHWGDHPIADVFRRTRVAAARIDIWRYCVLHDRGGIYLDIDATLRFALESLPKGISEVVSFEKNLLQGQLDAAAFPEDGWFEAQRAAAAPRLQHAEHVVLNWGLAFAPKHPILAEAIAIIAAQAESFRGRIFPEMLKAVVHFTGPLVLTRAVWCHVLGGNPLTQMGIDFAGAGVFKAASLGGVYHATPHWTRANNQILLD